MKKLFLAFAALLVSTFVLIPAVNSDISDPKVKHIIESTQAIFEDFTERAVCEQGAPLCYIMDESTDVHYYFVVSGMPGVPGIYSVHASKQIVRGNEIEVISEGIRRAPNGWEYFIDRYKVIHNYGYGESDEMVRINETVEIWDEVIDHFFE